LNILITGASGYIGKSLVKELSRCHHVLQIKNSKEYVVDNDIYYMNLLDASHVKLFLNEAISVDVVIHVASKMASAQSIYDLNILHDNIKMYEHLIDIVECYKPNKLINFSSIAVYPNIDGKYAEESMVKPSVNGDALYGLSKFCGENLLDHMLKNQQIDIVHLRVSQVFSDDLRDDRLYMMMKDELSRTNNITVYANGERVSNFIHKDLLISKVSLLIENDCTGIFNIGDKNLTYKEFANYVISQFGNINSKVIIHPNGSKSKLFINMDKFNSLESQC